MELKASKLIEVRFNEVDSMGIVWHGSYPIYYEDAREEFGKKYGLGYNTFFENDCPAPLVELDMQYKRVIRYGMTIRVDIIYRPTDSAKIVFDYEIHDPVDDSLLATAHSVQVFFDMNYELLWDNPKFYSEWKARWHQT